MGRDAAPCGAPDGEERPRICAAIAAALEQAEWSQQQLADALGVRQSSVARWCSFREPRLDRISSIEWALGLPRGQLLRAAGYVAGPRLVARRR